MTNPSIIRIFKLMPFLMERHLLRAWFSFVFFLIFSLHCFSQDTPKIFISGDVQVVGLSANIEVVQLDYETTSLASTAKSKISKKKASSKRSVAKNTLKPKQKTIKIKSKPNEFLTNTGSDQNIAYSLGKEHGTCTVNPSPAMKDKLTFHYTQFNIPIYIHLEKIYTKEAFLTSELSQFFFSRPPPFFKV